jgi:uncharacterized membrane protein
MKKITCDRIGVWIRKGIRRMLELCKRWGPQFLVAFAALAAGGAAIPIWLHGEWQYFTAILLGSLSLICLIAAIIALVYDIKDGRRKDREAKATKNYEALKESFKTLYIKEGKSLEEAQKLAEIAATGTPPAPPIEGEEEWMSPREAYRKSRQKKK